MTESFLVRDTRRAIARLLDAAVERVTARDPLAAHDMTRRQLLALLSRTTGSALVAAFGSSLLAACGSSGPKGARSALRAVARRNESVEEWLFRHTSMNHAAAPLSGAAFPSYFVAPVVPRWNEAIDGPWTLAVTGVVARPQRLSLAALQGLPRISQRVDHFCVEGWNAVATWHGVRVSDLARLAGAQTNGPGAARYVDFRSFDVDSAGGPGYHECWDLASALHPQTLVAYGMDGRLLSPAHGAPARLHSPIKLGYKNTKYLTEVVFRRDRTGGYWSDRGYEWYGGT